MPICLDGTKQVNKLSLKDERHAKLTLRLLEYEQKYRKTLKFKVEYAFNHYGNRGFIDLLGIQSSESGLDSGYFLYEVKPVLDDLGGTVRQIHKYINALQGTDDLDEDDWSEPISVLSVLVLEDIPENRDILKKYGKLLKLSEINNILLFPLGDTNISPKIILVEKLE